MIGITYNSEIYCSDTEIMGYFDIGLIFDDVRCEGRADISTRLGPSPVSRITLICSWDIF